MHIEAGRIRGILILRLSGRLALAGGDADLPARVETELAAGERRIVLDLTAVTYVDSAGVGAIVACAKRAGDAGGVVRLAVAESGAVRRVVEIAHLDAAFDVHPDAATAAAAFA